MKPAFEISGIKEYIAYDPGGHTGFAKCKVHLNESLLEIIEVGEFPIWHNIESQLARRDKDSFVVVYESFHLRMIEANLIPVEVIGVIKFLTDKKSILRYPQKPADRKSIEKIYPDLMNVITSHGADAVKHAVYFAMFTMKIKNLKIKINGNKKQKISNGKIYVPRPLW